MKKTLLAGLAVASLVLLAGCAQNYNIYTNGGRVITSKGKPRYDKDNSVFVFKDGNGDERRISAGSVRQIQPASDSSSPTSFNAPGGQ